MLGAPGSGKGTWSKFLSDALGLPHISSGDLFRRELAKDSPLGRQLRSYLDEGKLVPDDLTIRLLGQEIIEGTGQQGFILDGFPRTMAQAEALDALLLDSGQAIDRVVEIQVSEQVIIGRALSRFVCEGCGQPYNTTTMKPQVEGICDRCGGRIVRRSDDNEQTLKQRLKAYREKTAPLTDYYQQQGKLAVFPNDGPPDRKAQQELLELLGQAEPVNEVAD